ncbi:hypothetical protein T265_13557, partial [Opisthorchis viverrini]
MQTFHFRKHKFVERGNNDKFVLIINRDWPELPCVHKPHHGHQLLSTIRSSESVKLNVTGLHGESSIQDSLTTEYASVIFSITVATFHFRKHKFVERGNNDKFVLIINRDWPELPCVHKPHHGHQLLSTIRSSESVKLNVTGLHGESSIQDSLTTEYASVILCILVG